MGNKLTNFKAFGDQKKKKKKSHGLAQRDVMNAAIKTMFSFKPVSVPIDEVPEITVDFKTQNALIADRVL